MGDDVGTMETLQSIISKPKWSKEVWWRDVVDKGKHETLSFLRGGAIKEIGTLVEFVCRCVSRA
jgi:hypothetical protein